MGAWLSLHVRDTVDERRYSYVHRNGQAAHLSLTVARILPTSSAFCPELTPDAERGDRRPTSRAGGEFPAEAGLVLYWLKVLVGASPTERASVGNSNRCFDALRGAGVFTETFSTS
jgi:hypothetical protein